MYLEVRAIPSRIRRADFAQTDGMKLTTLLFCGYLIGFGVGAAVYALFGVNLLALVTFGNVYAYRALLSITGVAALWLLFWLLAFRPTKFLS